MRGFCGFLGRGMESTVKQMFDSFGEGEQTVQFEDKGLFIMASLDRESVGSDPDNRVMVIANGEAYPRNLKREVVENVDEPLSASFIAGLYLKLGLSAVNFLTGQFLIFIYDSNKQMALICTDIISHKKFYYTFKKNVMYFSSHFRSFLECGSLNRGISKAGLNLLLSYGYIPPETTILANVFKMDQASVMVVKNRCESSYYWSPRRIKIDYFTSEDEWCNRVYEALLRSMKRRLAGSERPVGLLLGGLDSSTIASFLRRLTDERLYAFTAVYADPMFNEFYAKDVAELLELDFNEVLIEPSDMPEILSKLPEVFDEPILDPIAVPATYALLDKARNKVKAVFEGSATGATFIDEVTHLRTRIKKSEIPIYFTPNLIKGLACPLVKLLINTGVKHGLMRVAERISTSPEKYLLDSEKSQLAEMAPSILRSEFFLEDVDHVLVERLKKFGVPSGVPRGAVHFYKKLSLSLLNAPVNPFSIPRTMKICDWFNLNAEIPFADREVVETTFSIPWYLRLPADSMSKYMLRKTVLKFKLLPKEIVLQPKKGLGSAKHSLFIHPMKVWMEKELRSYVTEAIAEGLPQVSHIMRPEIIRKIVRSKRPMQILPLMQFMQWYKTYFA